MSKIEKYSYSNDFDIPRKISPRLKLRFFFNTPLAFLGVFFFIMGAPTFIVFALNTDFKSAFVFNENDPSVNGVLTSIVQTSSSEGSKNNKQYIYEYQYCFQLNQKSYTNKSFALQSELALGDTVPVKYVVNHPEDSRIENMRNAPFQFFILPIIALFPLVSFPLMFFSFKMARKNVHLLQNGILTHGKVIRKEPTNMRVNKQPVYKVFFQFKTKEGFMQESFVETEILQNIEDEAQEPLLYDSNNPSSAVLLDSLPKKVRELIIG